MWVGIYILHYTKLRLESFYINKLFIHVSVSTDATNSVFTEPLILLFSILLDRKNVFNGSNMVNKKSSHFITNYNTTIVLVLLMTSTYTVVFNTFFVSEKLQYQTFSNFPSIHSPLKCILWKLNINFRSKFFNLKTETLYDLALY